MKVTFTLLRVAAGASGVIALGILALVVAIQSAAASVKQMAGILWAVGALFTSGFQKSPHLKDSSALDISWLQVLLAVVFLSMFVSAFLPGAKTFLHSVAFLGAVAACWCVWVTVTSPRTELIYLQFMGVWFAYYSVCVLWAWGARPLLVGSRKFRLERSRWRPARDGSFKMRVEFPMDMLSPI